MLDPESLKIVAVLVGLIISTGLYSWWLDGFDGDYNPHFTWLTVVGGCAQLWLAFVAFSALGVVPWTVTFLLAAVFFSGGAPVIGWQIGQNRRRKRDRKERRNGGSDAATPEGR